VVDNAIIKRPPPSSKTKKTERRRRKLQHLCIDKAYNSKQEEQELIIRGYVLHIPSKRKGDEKEEEKCEIRMEKQQQQQSCLKRKRYSSKRWVVERTNS
jgi:hypothetical protein